VPTLGDRCGWIVVPLYGCVERLGINFGIQRVEGSPVNLELFESPLNEESDCARPKPGAKESVQTGEGQTCQETEEWFREVLHGGLWQRQNLPRPP
jgi:hypothetical protein